VVTRDVCVRDWLCETKLGRSLLSCDSRPRMKSRYWLSCVRRGGSCLRHWVIGHRLAAILTGAFGTRIGGTRKRFVYRNCIWIQKEGSRDWGTVGCIVRLACLAIWVVSLSCLWPQWCKAYVWVSLEYWVFRKWVWSVTYCPGLWTSWVFAFCSIFSDLQ